MALKVFEGALLLRAGIHNASRMKGRKMGCGFWSEGVEHCTMVG
jgi:hypothetical protein